MSKVYNLSVCIIYREEDKGFLDGCLKSIPVGVETVICKTVPSKDKFYKRPLLDNIIKKEDGNGSGLITCNWIYYKTEDWNFRNNTYHFSEAKNQCKSQATRGYILFLDVDERLVIESEELEMINDLDGSIGGMKISVHSYTIPSGNEGEGKRIAVPIIRLFKNDTRINYINRGHEQIRDSILKAGYKIADSSILIKHLGYYGTDPEKIKDKIYRNIGLMASDLKDRPNDWYLCERQYTTLSLLKHNKGIETELPEVPLLMDILHQYENAGIKFEGKLESLMQMISATAEVLETNPYNKFALDTHFKALHYFKQLGGFKTR